MGKVEETHYFTVTVKFKGNAFSDGWNYVHREKGIWILLLYHSRLCLFSALAPLLVRIL